MKRDEVFVSRFQMRIQTSVRLPTTFGRLATFEIGFEIYQSENDDGQAIFFSSRACEQAAQLARVILSELLALIVQVRSEEHTSELQSQSNLVCRLLLEKKKGSSHYPLHD